MVCELFTLMQFFNPFMWLLRRDLKLIHEYQADEAVLNKGIDAQKYQLLVLEKAVGERRFAMANYFTQKPLLKRLKMMQKTKHRRLGGVKLLLFVPIIIVLLQAFAQPEILVDKASEMVPMIAQQDSSEIWINNWVNSKINAVTSSQNERKANNKTEVLHIIDPGNEKVIIDKNTQLKNNVFIVLHNSKGELLVENKRLEMKNLKGYVVSFLKGKNTLSGEIPSFKLEHLAFLGETKVSEGLIVYRNDLTTPKSSLKEVMEIFAEAILDCRKEVALDKFGKDYFELTSAKKEVIQKIISERISYAAPMGARKAPPPPPPPPPSRISLEKGGVVYLSKKKYSFEELENKLNGRRISWERTYKKWESKYKSYKVDNTIKASVEVGPGVTDEEVSKLKKALRNAKILDENVFWKVDDAPGKLKPPPPPPPIYRLHLYTDKLVFGKGELTLNEVAGSVEAWLKRYGSRYTASIKAHEGVSDEKIDELREEMKKGGVKNKISIRRVD